MKINTSVFLATTIVCYGLLSMKIKEAHAGALSSTLMPSETRRQGLAQENPCPGDTLMFTCTISSSTVVVRWRLNGTQLYAFVNPSDINSTESSNGLTGSLVNATTTTLLVDLSATLDAQVTNGTVIGCEEVDVTTTTETLTIIGVASPPTVSVRPGSLTSLTVDMTVPEYGRECVDMYRATAVVGGVTLEQTMTVTDPNQMMYSFEFSGLDLCRDMLTSATVVAVTNGVEGTMATPVTTDPLSGTNLLQVQLLDNGISSQGQLTSPIRWSQELNSTNVPSDCVSHFVISWNGSATGSYNTSNASTFSVSPLHLAEVELQLVCASVTLTISPFVLRFGAVTTSAAVVNTQPAYIPNEGFEDPMDVIIVSSFAIVGSEAFNFTVQWMQVTPSAIQAIEVGYSINGSNCTPTMTVDRSSNSQVVSLNNVEQLVGANVTACVMYTKGECISNVVSTAQRSTNITGLPLSDFMEVNGNVHITVRIFDSRFHQFGLVSIEPSGPSVASQSQGSSTSSWTVVFSGVTRGTTYTYILEPRDANGDTIGTAITGTFVLPRQSAVLGGGPIAGIAICALVVIIVVIVAVILMIVYKDVIFRCCLGGGKEDTDTHELKSPTDRNSVEHEQAPGGEEYAVVTTTTRSQKPAAPDAFYQDPATIKHEQAETGDLYAVADKPKKSSKKKEKSEDELAGMYSVPDKSKKNQNQLTYADIDIGVGSGKSVSQGPQTEYATVVN